MSEWVLVGTPRGSPVALLVSDATGPAFYWSPSYVAAMLGQRFVTHWQLAEPIDLRACRTRWVGADGTPVDDAALDGAFLVCANGTRIPLAQAVSLLGLEQPEAFVAHEIVSQSKDAGKDGAPGDASPRARRAAAVAVALNAGADWIDQNRSPLGRRKHMRLCREGVFKSARKQGKLWLVRRAEIDSYIDQNSKRPKANDMSEIDHELAALGMGEP